MSRQHLLEGAVGLREEVTHTLLLGTPQVLGGLEGVDEEPVSHVGGHAPGRGVRVHQVPVTFQRGHVVAHRGRGDVHAGVAHDV